MSDDLEEVVSEIEKTAVAGRDDLFADRQPWFYMGWCVFCQAGENGDGKPFACRPGEIIAVRPGAPGKSGLTIKGVQSTVLVYGDFMDVIDVGAII